MCKLRTDVIDALRKLDEELMNQNCTAIRCYARFSERVRGILQ